MITLRQIMHNIAKGQSAINAKAIIRDMEAQYKLIGNRIKIVGCRKDDEEIIVYTKIPSKDKTGIFYDVAIQFLHSGGSINIDTPMRVFSNSPVFAYNFCYVFYTNDSLLFPEKYPADFKRIAPGTRNPFETTSFDRQVFAAIKHIFQYKIPAIVAEYQGVTPAIPTFAAKTAELNDYRRRTTRNTT